MRKYFSEEKKEEILLSDFLKKDSTYFEKEIYDEKNRIRRTEYLIEILGDVSMDEDVYKLFMVHFQRTGGRYRVFTRPDTIKGIYEITKKYPTLTVFGIEDIWYRYIKDLFEEYDLTKVLDKFIEEFGEKDEAFEIFIDYVEKKAEKHQQLYISESLCADELTEEYGEKFTIYVKDIILRQHYTYDEVKKYLPSAELIKIDEKHILDISTKTRIYFGCCYPVSYTMFYILLEDKTLDTFTETPTYYISSGGEEKATFTKTEFLESIENRQKMLKR